MSYSGLPGRNNLDVLGPSKLIMSNKIGSSASAEHLSRNICLKGSNDGCTIASVAKLDAWIYVTVVFVCDKCNVELVKKQ